MHLDFRDSIQLLLALQWVRDPDPQAQQGSIRRFILLEQIAEERCRLRGWGIKDTCLEREIDSSGPQGTRFLIDAQHLLEVSSKNKAVTQSSLRLSQNQGNQVKVEAVSRIVGGEVEGYGNVNISTYAGSNSEFPNVSPLPHTVAVVRQWQLDKLTSRAKNYSKLAQDKCERHVLMRLTAAQIECWSAEPGAANGFAHCYQHVPLEVYDYKDEDLFLAVYGRYFCRAADVGTDLIEVRVDSLEHATLIQFVGNRGSLTTPLISDEYQIRYLTKGVYSFLGHPTVTMQDVAKRVFDCDKLMRCLEMQRPLKSSTRLDVRLEQAGSGLQISKMGDVRRSEHSIATNEDISLLESSWVTISCSHSYLFLAIEQLRKASVATINEARRMGTAPVAQANNDEFSFYGDEEPPEEEDRGEEEEGFMMPTFRVLLELKKIGNERAYLLYVRALSTDEIAISINTAATSLEEAQPEES